MIAATDRAVEESMRCWNSRFNCAESVLRGVCHGLDMDLPDVAKRMATPFGGGIGRSEDTCGALAGGVLAIGAYLGRVSPEQDRLMSYDAAHMLHKTFEGTFGSTVCKLLNRSDFDSAEHKARCGKFIEFATRSTIETMRGP